MDRRLAAFAGGRAKWAAHRRFPRRGQPARRRLRRLHRAHGARRANARRNAGESGRVVPRQRLAARARPAPPRARRQVRVGLPGPAAPRRQAAGRAGRAACRFHRSPRLGGGLLARGWLDRPRPHLRPLGGGGAHPPCLLAAPGVRRPDLRGNRTLRGHVRVFQHGQPAGRAAPCDAALLRGAVGPGRRPRLRGRQGVGGGGRAPHPWRGAHICCGRRHGGRAVDNCRGRARQAGACRSARAAAARSLRAGRPSPPRAG